MRSSKTGRKTSSTASAVWHVANIILFNSFNMARQRSPLTVTASPCLFSKKNCPIIPLDQNPHQTLTFWVQRLFNVCVRVFCASNATILLVYISAKIKMSFIWKDDFYFLPKSASSVSRSVAIFPSVVQAYTQPYSFGGRIKLIRVCPTHFPHVFP